MNLTLLHVPDCPNVAPLLRRLRQITDQPVTTLQVDTAPEAVCRGMHGSPTLLVDGADPFATPDLATGLACRLYRNEQGRATGVPSAEQLRAVLQGTMHP